MHEARFQSAQEIIIALGFDDRKTVEEGSSRTLLWLRDDFTNSSSGLDVAHVLVRPDEFLTKLYEALAYLTLVPSSSEWLKLLDCEFIDLNN